ncbi:uncharacterized protein [Epargyreus clarus]|uniref:uncharacterized protein n=1 Tax=Epargyreus clarus TaxID=520877 RepID=UPI003C300D5C
MRKFNVRMDSKFHVIEFLERPYTDLDKYICIPNSWIRLREDCSALVHFPIEELSKTKKLAKREQFSNNWPVFLAEIKYSTDSYTDAKECNKKLNEISPQNQKDTVLEGIPSTSDKKVLNQPSPESEHDHILLTLRYAQVTIKQTAKRLAELEASRTANTVSLPDHTPRENTPGSSNYLAESSRTNVSSDRQEQILILRSILNAGFRENLKKLHSDFEKIHVSLENMCLEIVKNCEMIAEIRMAVDNSGLKYQSSRRHLPEVTRATQGPFRSAVRLVLGDNYIEILKQFHSGWQSYQITLEIVRMAFVRNCEIIAEFIKFIDEVVDSPDYARTVEGLEKSMMEGEVNKNN